MNDWERSKKSPPASFLWCEARVVGAKEVERLAWGRFSDEQGRCSSRASEERVPPLLAVLLVNQSSRKEGALQVTSSLMQGPLTTGSRLTDSLLARRGHSAQGKNEPEDRRVPPGTALLLVNTAEGWGKDFQEEDLLRIRNESTWPIPYRVTVLRGTGLREKGEQLGSGRIRCLVKSLVE